MEGGGEDGRTRCSFGQFLCDNSRRGIAAAATVFGRRCSSPCSSIFIINGFQAGEEATTRGRHITSAEKFTSCFYHTSHVNVVLGEVAGRLGQLGDIGTFAEVQLPQMLEDACGGNTATQVIVIHATGKLATAVTIK